MPKRIIVAVAILISGCTAIPRENPSMPISSAAARINIRNMERHPVPLLRPLVVVSGFSDFGIPGRYLAGRFRRVFEDPRIIETSWYGCHTFDACADRLIAKVESRFPSANPLETVEVDVVAVSMGGLVSRYATLPHSGRKRLKIVRLFTISTPHRGADLAVLPTFETVQCDMRFESDFLRSLNRIKPPYPIYPYVRLGDMIVGAKNAAPPGEIPWWLPREDLSPAHGLVQTDDRIFLDIALRLRNETPVSTVPRTPLPGIKP